MNEKSNKLMRPVREYFKQNWGILAALVAMCLFFSIFGSNFLTKTNIVNLLRTCATNCAPAPPTAIWPLAYRWPSFWRVST